MKTILVVDIGNDEYLLNKKIDAICFEDGDKIYDNFNFLKPMPKKIKVDVKLIEDIMHTEFQMTDFIRNKFIAKINLETDKLIAIGYNRCIDEILESNRRNRMEIKGFCKDCKYFMNNYVPDELDNTDYEDVVCTYHMSDGFTSNDYCSMFEQKEEEAE